MNKDNTPCYLVTNFRTKDLAGIRRYQELVGPLVRKHNGKLIALNPEIVPLEGAVQPSFVMVEFPSKKEAEAFYHAPEYQPVKEIRLNATEGGFLFLIEGIS